MGPTQQFYESLIPEFDGMPQAQATIATMLTEIAGSVARAMRRFRSMWGVDALDDEDTTSAKNSSSAITLLTFEGRYLLFTGDAGITALTSRSQRVRRDKERCGVGANSDTTSWESTERWTHYSQPVDRKTRAAGRKAAHKSICLNRQEGRTEAPAKGRYKCVHTSWSQCRRYTRQVHLLFQ